MVSISSPSLSSSHDWLMELAKESLGDFELTRELDAELSAAALAARHDLTAREELFRALALKTRRFCSRFRRWNLDPWDFDDVLQETFPVFVDLLRTWRPLDGSLEPAGFGFYFVAVFPLRLTDRVNALLRTRRGGPTLLPWKPEIDLRLEPSDLQSDVAEETVLADICGRLNAVDAAILRSRASDGFKPDQLATTLGISRRTLYRRWSRVAGIVREELAS